MKYLFYTLTSFLLFFSSSSLQAQQNREMQRSKIIFAYPQFKTGKILQSFGRSVTDSVNIFLKDASLLFMKDGKIMKANLNGILGLKIDSIEYKKVNNQLGRIIKRQGFNFLLCVTSIDMHKYKSETHGGDKLPYFDLNDGACFIELNQNEFDSEKGLPLKNKYYFWLKGTEVPANESSIKPFIRDDKKENFKELMADRWWSWKDPQNLCDLFKLLKP